MVISDSDTPGGGPDGRLQHRWPHIDFPLPGGESVIVPWSIVNTSIRASKMWRDDWSRQAMAKDTHPLDDVIPRHVAYNVATAFAFRRLKEWQCSLSKDFQGICLFSIWRDYSNAFVNERLWAVVGGWLTSKGKCQNKCRSSLSF